MRLACGTLPPPSLLPPHPSPRAKQGVIFDLDVNTSAGELMRCDWTFAGGNRHLLGGDQPTDAASTTSGHSGVRGWSRDHAAMIPFLVGFVPPPADLEKKEKKEAIEGAHCRMPWPVDSIISMPPSPQVSGNKSLCSGRALARCASHAT